MQQLTVSQLAVLFGIDFAIFGGSSLAKSATTLSYPRSSTPGHAPLLLVRPDVLKRDISDGSHQKCQMVSCMVHVRMMAVLLLGILLLLVTEFFHR